MSLPTVHLNGTSREELIQLRLEAVTAIREAIVALRKAAPHGRDYYVQSPEAYRMARAVWEARLDALENVAEELRSEALEIQDQ
jgi:hypothetical protein